MFDVSATGMQNIANNAPQRDIENDGNDYDGDGDGGDPDDPDDPIDSDDDDYNPENDDVSQHKIPIPERLLKKISQSKASYRISEQLLKIGIELPGADPNDFAVSKTTVWRNLTNLRSDQRDHLLEILSNQERMIVQFDGKNYGKLGARHTGRNERIIIVCHTERGDIALGLFVVDSKAGIVCATKVADILRANCVATKVVGVGCDLEPANTGIHTGACVLLERFLDKPLLRFMCRHHIYEIVLKTVFIHIFGATEAPNIRSFDTLKENWHNIPNNRYMPIDAETFLDPLLQGFVNGAKTVLLKHAKEAHFRNDYSEFIDLALKFLGVNTVFTFKVPGATSNARWMGRGIYALKTYLFRHELDLDVNIIRDLERFCLFVVLVYIKRWNECSNAADAPINDLKFLKELNLYSEFDNEIATTAGLAFENHLWYLSDELIILSLFSDKVSTEEKFNMVQMLTPDHEDRTNNSLRHTTPINNIQNKQLYHFVSTRSTFLLNQLEIDKQFLQEDPDVWAQSDSYISAKKRISDFVVVVNDSCERGIHLGSQLIDGQRIKSEERLQDFLVSTYAKHYEQ